MDAKPQEERERLDIDFSDEDFITALKGRITRSRDFYDGKKKLKTRRKKLENYYKGDHEPNQNLYDYQTPYMENLVFMQVEHAVNALNARVAEPVIETKNKSVEAKEAANAFHPFLKRWVELNRVTDLARVATRHNMIKFIGTLKVRWDEFAGPIVDGVPIGDVVVEAVEPENVIFDHNTRYFQEPPLIAERLYEPVEDIVKKFPEKEQKLLDHYNITEKMGRSIHYWEVHFSYWEEDNKPQQGIAWFSDDLNFVIGKTKSPFWDELGETDPATGETTFKNILDHPLKPYPLLSSINLGKGVIDDTTAVEQIIPLQDIIDKRGRQITQAADDVRGGWAFSEDYIDRDEAAELINDPFQSIWGKGDVQAGAQRLPPPPLPAYVVRSMIDARQALDNVFGFHGTSRGEREGTDQPTTIQLLKEGDFERQDGLVAGIDRMMERTYQLVAHLMALNYTDDHWKHYGVEGGTQMIKNIKNVYVKAGTTLPTDKLSQREEAKELMNLGKIDYESFFDRMGWPDPKKMARRLFLHERSPESLYVSKDAVDLANEHVEIIKHGNSPVVPDEITEDYVAAMNAVMRDPERFNELSEHSQSVFANYMAKLVETAGRRAGAVQGGQAAAQAQIEQGQLDQPGQPPVR